MSGLYESVEDFIDWLSHIYGSCEVADLPATPQLWSEYQAEPYEERRQRCSQGGLDAEDPFGVTSG